MSDSLLFSQLEKSLHTLKKECGAFAKKNIKDSISKSMKHLQSAKNQPSTIDLDIVISPLFAILSNPDKDVVIPVLDFTANFFQYSTENVKPKAETTKKILDAIFKFVKNPKTSTDQIKAKVSKIISSIIENQYSRSSLHGRLLNNIFSFLINLQKTTPGSTGEIISMTTQNLFRIYLDLADEEIKRKNAERSQAEQQQEPQPEPEVHENQEESPELTVDDISRNTITHIISLIMEGFGEPPRSPPQTPQISRQSSSAASALSTPSKSQNQDETDTETEDGSYSAEKDVITIVRTFSHLVEQANLTGPTLRTCGESLSMLLESHNSLIDSPAFEELLKKDIHVAIIGLALDTSMDSVQLTSKLIIDVWQRFPQLYLVGLNEVLDKGLATALTSPYPNVVVRAIRLFNELAKAPQLLVDAFVNYDCDQSGFFRNIYKNIVERVVNCAKPGQSDLNMQPAALDALITTLDSLWKFFKEKTQEAKNTEVEEAQNFLDAKKAKDVFDQGLQIFKNSEKKGLIFFQEHNLCGKTPEEIADFLFNTPSLDPASIGQILGGSKPEHAQILRSFINKFDFKGMSFEEAFRAFLSKFLIPGESQMIDRIMEQFGSKFYNDNTSLFSCAETVYVLAFSALMLHTDAHHPTIKKHMTLPEFIANNKGIDQGRDLPEDFLAELYRGITSKKIFVSQNALPSSGLLTREQKADMYKQQCQQALQSARESTTDTKGLAFHRSESPLLIGPMFQTIWGPVLAALTMTFETTEEMATVEECLTGFQLSLHIASHCYVEEALQTLVDSFAKFTRLRTAKAINDVKEKNIMCTNALIKCAIEDHLYLKGAWSIVLGELSALDIIKDSNEFETRIEMTDDLFRLSSQLDRESILDFVHALCQISAAELDENPPRMFSLQKIADIADFNMDRPMYIWKEIWNIISTFFVNEGCSRNEVIANNVVDVLRQIARKFIPKQDKDSQIALQSHFLQPFNDIFSTQDDIMIKELILFCTQQLIQEHASILYSGWDVIFQILTSSAMDEKLKKKGFDIAESIITKHMAAVIPYASHMVIMLSAFVTKDANAEISEQATEAFKIVADAIPADQYDTWFCLLQSLGKCNQHPLVNVKQKAEGCLLTIIIDKGAVRKVFTSKIWEFIFNTSLRDLFDFPDLTYINSTPAAPKKTQQENEENNEEQVPEQVQEQQQNDVQQFEMSSENVSIYKHNIDLLNNIVDNLIIRCFDVIQPYTSYFLSFISYLCTSPNRKFIISVISALDRFIEQTISKFDDNIVNDLMNILEELEERCKDLVYFVNTLKNIIKLFSGNESVFQRTMKILQKISTELEEKHDDNVSETLCAARSGCMIGFVSHGQAEESSEFLNHSLDMFVEKQRENKLSEPWNKLIEESLHAVAEADDTIFNKCMECSMKDLLEAIETESPLVRKEIILIMKRKLSQ